MVYLSNSGILSTFSAYMQCLDMVNLILLLMYTRKKYANKSLY